MRSGRNYSQPLVGDGEDIAITWTLTLERDLEYDIEKGDVSLKLENADNFVQIFGIIPRNQQSQSATLQIGAGVNPINIGISIPIVKSIVVPTQPDVNEVKWEFNQIKFGKGEASATVQGAIKLAFFPGALGRSIYPTMICNATLKHGWKSQNLQVSCGKENVNGLVVNKDALEIVNLKEPTVNRIEFKADGETQTFVGNVWNIRVYNPLYNSINNCRAEARIFRNKIDSGNVIPLLWSTSDKLPTSCHAGFSFDKEEINDVFAVEYIGDLFTVGTSYIVIPPRVVSELFLFFTFSESDSMYLVTHTSEDCLTTENLISIPFSELNQHTFLIKFYGEEYSRSEAEMFRLEAKCWNDVNLVKA
ncbi:MAG: hypothetical protein WA667_25355 [Candidatus Nitrosopolaris sp.]